MKTRRSFLKNELLWRKFFSLAKQLCLFLTVGGLAGSTCPSLQAQRQRQQPPIIRSHVDVVNVICTVRDKKGHYVSNLPRNAFEVYEDGARQKIEFFSYESGEQAEALTVVLLVDTSGSVKNKLLFEQKAANEFLSQTLRKNKDMAAVVQFDSDINLVQDFTYDLPTLERAIFSIRAGGATKLYDAIWVTVKDLLSKEVGRRVLVILSDGQDTQSDLSDDDAIRVAQKQDVIIFGIGVEGDTNFGALKGFAKNTGGSFFRSKADLQRLREVFSEINKEIKNQYSIGYVSTNPARDGSFREIEIRVRGRNLRVRHRRGYYAPGPDSSGPDE